MRILIGVLVAALVVVVGVGELRRQEPAKEALPFEPGRVSLADEFTQSETLEAPTRDFVLQVALQNHNQQLAHVRGMAMPDQDPAYARLAVAVMPGFATSELPSYDEVAAASARPVPLEPGAVAQLAVAGRLRCTPRPQELDWLMVMVEDQPLQIALPEFETQPWPLYVAEQLCD